MYKKGKKVAKNNPKYAINYSVYLTFKNDNFAKCAIKHIVFL